MYESHFWFLPPIRCSCLAGNTEQKQEMTDMQQSRTICELDQEITYDFIPLQPLPRSHRHLCRRSRASSLPRPPLHCRRRPLRHRSRPKLPKQARVRRRQTPAGPPRHTATPLPAGRTCSRHRGAHRWGTKFIGMDGSICP